MCKNRIHWIDSLRAIAVFCIVLGHALRGKSIYYYLYSFHVPLCVVISGFCFSIEGSVKSRIKKIVQREYLPYIFFSLISISIYVITAPITEGKSVISKLPKFIIGALYGNGNFGMSDGGYMRWNLPLWYLPFSTLMHILAILITRNQRHHVDQKTENVIFFLVSYLIAEVWRYSPFKNLDFPFGFETVVALFPLFWLGRVIREYKLSEKGSYIEKSIIGVGSIIFGLFVESFNSNVDYVSDYYGKKYILFFLAAMTISIGLCMIATMLPILPKIEYFGRNTLPVLGLHKFFVMYFYLFAISKITLLQRYILLSCLLSSTITVVFCLCSDRLWKKIIERINSTTLRTMGTKK